MIGDCYFLNQDYEVAAQFYWNVLSNLSTFNLDSGWEADLWLRFVSAKSRSGDLEGVGTLIKQASLFERISQDSYWSIEWNLIIGLKKHLKQNLKLKKLALEYDIPIYTVNHASVFQLTRLLQFVIDQKL